MYRIVRYWDEIPINIAFDNIRSELELQHLWFKYRFTREKHGYSKRISEKVFIIESDGSLTPYEKELPTREQPEYEVELIFEFSNVVL